MVLGGVGRDRLAVTWTWQRSFLEHLKWVVWAPQGPASTWGSVAISCRNKCAAEFVTLVKRSGPCACSKYVEAGVNFSNRGHASETSRHEDPSSENQLQNVSIRGGEKIEYQRLEKKPAVSSMARTLFE